MYRQLLMRIAKGEHKQSLRMVTGRHFTGGNDLLTTGRDAKLQEAIGILLKAEINPEAHSTSIAGDESISLEHDVPLKNSSFTDTLYIGSSWFHEDWTSQLNGGSCWIESSWNTPFNDSSHRLKGENPTSFQKGFTESHIVQNFIDVVDELAALEL
jgi:hypothetical protein